MGAAARSGVFSEELATGYDETRELGTEGLHELTRLLRGELAERGLVLEVGVGTGRVALPLAEAGIPMVGLDPSGAMLQRVVDKGGGRVLLGLVRGDGLQLPFPDATLGGILFCHVLHLIADWRGAISEAARVLCPGGRILLEAFGGGERWQGVQGRVRRHFHRVLKFSLPSPIGTRDDSAIDSALAEMGWHSRRLPPVIAIKEIALGDLLDRMERGISSTEQSIPAADRHRGWEVTKRWVEAELGSLEQTVELRRELMWHVYERSAGDASSTSPNSQHVAEGRS